MPRTLPWARTTTQKQAENVQRKRVQRDDEPESASHTRPSTPSRKGKAIADRAPSSSPPPAPRSPPRIEPLKPGLQADDIWIMVEDELMATAKSFTQHLHAAEYRRLRELAKQQTAARRTLSQHPTTTTTTTKTNTTTTNTSILSAEARIRNKAADAQDHQRTALAKLPPSAHVANQADEDSDVDAPFMRDPRLSSLMRWRPPMARQLSRVTGAKANTRAAAGLTGPKKRAPVRKGALEGREKGLAGLAVELGMVEREGGDGDDGEEEDVDSDDLDAVLVRERSPVRRKVLVRREMEAEQGGRVSGTVEKKRSGSPMKGRDKKVVKVGRADTVLVETDPPRRESFLRKTNESEIKRTKASRIFSVGASSASSSGSRWMDSDDKSAPRRSTPADRSNPKSKDLSITQQIAKKKASRASKAHDEAQEKRKRIDLDEIPTFMF